MYIIFQMTDFLSIVCISIPKNPSIFVNNGLPNIN